MTAVTPRISRAVPRHGRKVTAGDLRRLETSQDTHYLYCQRCHGTYSADHRDYFNRPDHTRLTCCSVNNWLCRVTRP